MKVIMDCAVPFLLALVILFVFGKLVVFHENSFLLSNWSSN